GCAVTVFEKSRGLGGRCSSRRWQNCVVDHGAQYWTMRDAGFRGEVERTLGPALGRIEAPILEGADRQPVYGEYFYHQEGNSRLCRALSQGVPVQLECPVIPERVLGGGWRVGGQIFDRVIATAPWPQVAGWFSSAGESGLDAPFVPCLAAWFLFGEEPRGLAATAYAIRPEGTSTLAWTACENHKVGRVGPGHSLFLGHATETFSRQFWAEPAELWSQAMLESVVAEWDLDPGREVARGWHRWRYARVTGRVLVPEFPEGFRCVGDGVAGRSRVETAWLSGRTVDVG
ncbi:MAG: NAD(P)-binding protein, partial [Verrucomicrobiia bacterium]